MEAKTTAISMTRAVLKKELLLVLARHVGPGVHVTVESAMVGDLSLDSLAVMEIMAEIEDRFGIHVPDDALMDLRTVADVLRALESRLHIKGILTE